MVNIRQDYVDLDCSSWWAEVQQLCQLYREPKPAPVVRVSSSSGASLASVVEDLLGDFGWIEKVHDHSPFPMILLGTVNEDEYEKNFVTV